MIIVQLKGGLGNQMFQYAAGLSLALHHGVQVKADVSLLEIPDVEIGTLRSYDLHWLTEPPAIATTEERQKLLGQSFIARYFEKLLPPHKRKIYKEAAFTFDPHFFEAGADVYLKGYRQSERYIGRFERQVRAALEPDWAKFRHLSSWAEQLRSTSSIAVHIRRGDYINKAVDNYYAILGMEYYSTAVEQLKSLISEPVFYIFTDDPVWLNDSSGFSSLGKVLSGTVAHSALDDFHLMSQCRHNIIANSSFSWWGAWLNKNPGKVVVAPEKWFDQAPLDTRDLIPGTWLKL